MHNMPRSFPYSNNWRLVLVALVFIAPLFFALSRAGAQQRGKAVTTPAQTQPKKTLMKLSTTETPEGSSLTIVSDSALNDYSAYRSGDRFYVLIPAADASRVANGLRGRGFADVRAQKRGADVLLSFRLLQGATARVSQKFNRLEIIITVPALVASNSQTNTSNPANSNSASNPNNRTQPNNSTGAGNTGNTGTANPNQRTGNGGTRFNSGGENNSSANSTGSSSTNPIGVTPQNNGGQQNPIATNPNLNNQPPGIPVTPNGTVTQSGTEGFPPVNQPSPLASPTASTPSDQVAQTLPNTPVNPATTNAPPGVTTNAPAPSSGSSLGATLKQNWVFIALVVVAACLIGWFVLARSRTESPVERRFESIREAKAEPIKEATAKPAIFVAPVVTPAPKVEAEPLVEPAVEPVEFESEPAALESGPAASIAAPLAAELVSAPVTEEEEPVAEVEAEEAAHAKELEPVVPVAPVATETVATEQAADEVGSLLAGHSYDETIINTQHDDARQMVAAELLAALAGRNTVRHERAREAFIKYGYFDDATRTLRTAESPAERASAARSLGLVRDQSATPHLVAALEDDSPEVRRAAVESLAEVRDPAGVAALEALRDREKDRRIPAALIQHAIEASVIGRMKVEPTQPVASPYATTPLTEPAAPETTPLPAGFVVEPPAPVEEAQAEEAVEAAPPAVVEAFEPQVVEATEPQIAEEAAEPQVVEAETEAVETSAPELFETPTIEAAPVESEAVIAPLIPEDVAPQVEAETHVPTSVEPPAPVVLEDAVAEAEPVQLAPESVVEAAPAETPAPMPEETPAPVATAEPLVEHTDGTASDWVDVDVSAPASQAALPLSAPVAPVEEAAVTDLPAPEAPPQVAEPVIESVVEAAPEIVAPTIAPVVVAPVAAALSSTEERGIDVATETVEPSKELDVAAEDASNVPSVVLRRLASEDASERAAAVGELGRIGGDDSFREISAAFDDPSPEVRNAAARSLYNLNPDRAASFTRALREAPAERRRHIGAALASSGLATEAIGHLMGESREKTYDAFSLLFLMSKAGEVQPLMRAVEEHPNSEVRLAVVKLLALSGQQEILPAFRRLAVRGSLPTEVRSAVMEAIYQISSQTPGASA